MKSHMRHSGFTLVEVMVSISLFSIIIGGIAAFSAYYFNNYSFSFEENQSVNIAQTALTSMTREIREARDAGDGSWPIVEANDNEFIFYSDITGDGQPDRIRYFVDGTTLKKGVIQPTAVPVAYPEANETIYTVATNMDLSAGAIFTYYNGSWPSDTINNPIVPDARVSDTRCIGIRLKINLVSNAGSQPFELTGSTTIRSLKDNL